MSDARSPRECGAVPRITLSTLARLMGPVTTAEMANMVRRHKRRAEGPMRSYQAARRQAIELFVDKKPLCSTGELRSYEREAVAAMVRMRLRAPEWMHSRRPARTPPWHVAGVDVSLNPDVELVGSETAGAAKFCFSKSRLAPGVGATMAALLWVWRRHLVGDDKASPEACILVEPRLPWIHRPGGNPERRLKHVELTCRLVAAMWPEL